MEKHITDLIRSIIPIVAVIVGWLLNALTNRYQYERKRKAELENRKAHSDMERLETLYKYIYDLRRQFDQQIELIEHVSQQSEDQSNTSTSETEKIKLLDNGFICLYSNKNTSVSSRIWR